MNRKPEYPKLAPGQPPQLLTYADPPAAYCIQSGQPITQFAPQRPMSLACWGKYRHLSLWLFRTGPQRFCHGCGTEAPGITFGSPLCGNCAETRVVA